MTDPSTRYSICLLEDTDSRLLLARRSADAGLGAGQWGFPAGHIEAGESPRECAHREMIEEIGPRHEVQELRSLGPIRDTFYGGKGTKRGRGKAKKAKKKPDHYDVICISLYKEDLAQLDEMVAKLKKRGHRKISRSALIRFALDQVDIRDFPRAY